MTHARRDFLKMLAAAGAAGTLPASIAHALTLPANRRTGTIRDVEHVVILMQENRSFDHYYGMLRGVRGFGDPRPVRLPGGAPVWQQPVTRGAGQHVLPFRLNADGHNQNAMQSLDHSWKEHHDIWKHHDAWIEKKTAITMGHHTRADLPFYYALADAFTICDGYHASIQGPTNPNRMYLFTGTSGLTVGDAGKQTVHNMDDGNWTADSRRDAKTYAGLEWTTYAERLEAAGVSWKVYQEYDNFGDNSLAYFKSFRGLDPASPLHAKARAVVPGSTAANAERSEGEHLAAALRSDVQAGTLPQVSWIAASAKMCEHPASAGLEYGQFLVAQLLDALTSNPEVWARTVFLINYDENDGFFDHVPPPLPAVNAAMGGSTVNVAGEVLEGEPVGLGIRVPMLVISPWSKGGWVNSQVFDHTSVLRFLETRFGVHEPNISPWRRTVTGDLTSAFDFSQASANISRDWPDTANSAELVASGRRMKRPAPPPEQMMPVQEPGQRLARALPYRLRVDSEITRGKCALRFANQGTAGATLLVTGPEYDGPWFYTVGSGQELTGEWSTDATGRYDLEVHGPNGFFRVFRGHTASNERQVDVSESLADRLKLLIHVRNTGADCTLIIDPRHYHLNHAARIILAAGAVHTLALSLTESDHWYDVAFRIDGVPAFERRLAGHIEVGKHSRSDPALGTLLG